MTTSLFQFLCQDSTLQAAWRQVKGKNSAGGIDGISLAEFEKDLYQQIQTLALELKNRKWKPQPYLQMEVPKKNKKEMRKLGLLSVRDKVVQYAIKQLVEPRAERLFTGSNYGYRPGKGATKAIRRSLQECNMKKNKWVLRLDVDNFFDTIDHSILQARLHALVNDPEMVRLMMLVVKMGKVKADGTWVETEKGVPQGAVLSPLLANIYLHSFDQFVLYRKLSYVRYADDFIIFCETREQAETILNETNKYLKNKLKLSLNPPVITEVENSFDFLGITLQKHRISISDEKRKELVERIAGIEFDAGGFSSKSLKAWNGICNYYAQLLSQSDLELFDRTLIDRFQTIITEDYKKFANKSILQRALGSVCFLSGQYSLNKKKTINELTENYLIRKRTEQSHDVDNEIQKIVRARKSEYRRKEASMSELLVNKPGTFIGLTNRGVTIREKGKVLGQQNVQSLSHIVVIGKGISLSSNLLEYCMNNKLPIDFFDSHGIHIGSFLSPGFMEDTLWKKQALASSEFRGRLALDIITGKLKNQFNLIKYFHKYHRTVCPNLVGKYQAMDEWMQRFIGFRKTCNHSSNQIIVQLKGYESQMAVRYWAYIRELFVDDQTMFVKRERKGATDIVNCMLNYGYAMLYVRVWEALLAAKLNPYDSILHVPQAGKPTLVYDVVEIFRSQVVDRVVISIIQKGTELSMSKGLLSDNTRQLLAKNVMERLNRYENFRGEELKMGQIILRQCMDIATCFSKGERYKPYVAKW